MNIRNLTLLLAWLISFNLAAKDRKLLENSISRQELTDVLDKGTGWVGYPGYSERGAWESIAPEVRSALILKGEEASGCEWPVVKATDYLEFIRSGNRQIMERPQNIRQQAIRDLALAELAEGKGRFIEPLMNGVWAMCEQSTWVLSAHLTLQKKGAGLPDPDDIVIDLASGNIGAMLSWVHYYFSSEFDKVNPVVSERLRREIRERILEPYYTRNDLWWMGFKGGMVNNWNVWVNYNVMQCILLMEQDQRKRADNIYKAMLSIDKFINYYHDDGGCDEGPSYWGHAGGKFFEGLELLYRATDGKINLYQDELVKNIGRYIYRAYISAPYFVNFADAGAKGGIYPGLVYRYGKAINDPLMEGFGAFYAQRDDFGKTIPSGTLETIIHDLFDTPGILAAKPVEPLIGECWLPGSQFVVARDKEGSKNGFYFAAKGGHNNESHNHNDVGTFILYYNGLPALVDVGVGTYTRQTFSSERYSIWTMQSGYHNLPVINGVEQKFGSQYAARNLAFKSSAGSVEFTVDIAGAYPQEAKVQSWYRNYKLQRGKNFTINDTYSLSANNGKNELHFMTCCKVTTVKPGILRLEGDGFVLELVYNKSLGTKTENVEITDPRLQAPWGNSLTRIILSIGDNKTTGKNSISIRPVK